MLLVNQDREKDGVLSENIKEFKQLFQKMQKSISADKKIVFEETRRGGGDTFRVEDCQGTAQSSLQTYLLPICCSEKN